MGISKTVAHRISSELKRYQGILQDAKKRDVSESDTVVIVGDMLADVFGYKKYQEITTEFAIRGTYVDLTVRVESEIHFLIEAKAIGVELKDSHAKQAIDYGANQGVEWVVLTNGVTWRAYRIHFTKPIDRTQIFEIDVLACNPRSPDVIECFGSLTKEGFSKSQMSELYQQKLVTSPYFIAQALLDEEIVDELRKLLRRLSPGLRVENEFLSQLLRHEVLKRELTESDEAKTANAAIKKLGRGAARERRKSEPTSTPGGTSGPAASENGPKEEGD